MEDFSKEQLARLGEAIRAERRRQDISQTKLGYMIGADQTYVSRLEAGRYNIQYRKLCKIAEALGVDVADLVR